MGKYFLRYPNASISRARKLRREMTNAERKLWSFLRNNQLGVHFRRQVAFGPYVLDFLAIKARLVVELDGSQHYTPEGRKRDSQRDAYLKQHGLTVLRFSDTEFLQNTDSVLHEIYEYVKRFPHNDDPILTVRLSAHGEAFPS
jgi:very-short-patch-repair endonuclease